MLIKLLFFWNFVFTFDNPLIIFIKKNNLASEKIKYLELPQTIIYYDHPPHNNSPRFIVICIAI